MRVNIKLNIRVYIRNHLRGPQSQGADQKIAPPPPPPHRHRHRLPPSAPRKSLHHPNPPINADRLLLLESVPPL